MGPEGRAWAARLDAEWLRWRWAAQLDPPQAGELVAAWRAAEDAAAAYSHVLDLARVRGRFAAVLRATGDGTAARELGDLARRAAEDLGARPLLDELVLLGSTSTRLPASLPGAHRPRARDPRAGGRGRTNGEIGRQLFISTKTVSVHVSNILAKLGRPAAPRRPRSGAVAGSWTDRRPTATTCGEGETGRVTEPFRCSLASEADAEPMAGTAPPSRPCCAWSTPAPGAGTRSPTAGCPSRCGSGWRSWRVCASS
ncbi:MAG: LuxR C-terminal-related transcriptional regulator [Nocardioides sp.]